MVRPTAKQLTNLYTANYKLKSNQSINTDLLDEILKSVWATEFHPAGGIMYTNKDLKAKAAVQCLEIARRRPYPEHNISMALLSTLTFLDINSYTVNQSPETLAELCELLLAAEDSDVRDATEKWFAKNMVSRI